ncbi:hypothetical protein [Erysipelothrix aquatica]|uniref:hypothetical protein n=1 Tax=Erysipelothrix aquatica TaxID=2683714 RepID=UPI0013571695|nr:hypothetical protein [Erysipelothrix aquatica]
MTKYDDILNELVYKIDDVVYDFYSKSNELIATKANQDRLFTFRDKTINTINDMNVRSLEMISGFRSESLVRERTENLYDKNIQLIQSAYDVIEASPNKSEFLEDVQNFASGVYTQAKDMVKRVEDSGAIDRITDSAQVGFKKVQDSWDEFATNPTVVKNVETLKEKTKEAVDYGAKVIQDTSKFVADKVSETKEKPSDPSSIYVSSTDELRDVIEDVTEHTTEQKDDN